MRGRGFLGGTEVMNCGVDTPASSQYHCQTRSAEVAVHVCLHIKALLQFCHDNVDILLEISPPGDL